MTTSLKTKNHKDTGRRALTAPEVVTHLAKLDGWKLTGDGPAVAIEKSYNFANYYETISFVNAVAFIANKHNHHPALSVYYNGCLVNFNTHDVSGITVSDFECAEAVDQLLS